VFAAFARSGTSATVSRPIFKERVLATPRKIVEQAYNNPALTGLEPKPNEEPLGEQPIREARQGHADFLAGWTTFVEQAGIRGAPVGAKKLRALLLQTGINADANEFSRSLAAVESGRKSFTASDKPYANVMPAMLEEPFCASSLGRRSS
jgi:hypothetical protein